MSGKLDLGMKLTSTFVSNFLGILIKIGGEIMQSGSSLN